MNPPAPARRLMFRDVSDRRRLLGALSPNWYASIMGTGIVVTSAASLPVQFPGLRIGATVVWMLAVILLVFLTVTTIIHWIVYPSVAHGWLTHPTMAHFFGAPAMAFLTVGAGTLLLGRDVIGESAAILVDAVLWSIGTAIGLGSAWWVTHAMITRIPSTPDDAFGGWLMPVVPPMVSAATGALLIPFLPEGQARLTMLLACYGMFGLTLLASLPLLTMIWARFLRFGIGAAASVPTMWIVLGPLGQSVTAANQLGDHTAGTIGAPYADALAAFGIVYGVPVLGFAMLWAVLALGVTIRTARERLPFSLTWWSFTFPVGTCVTGASQLAHHTGADALAWLAVILFAGLITAWITVAARTAHGTIVTGRLLTPTA